MVRFEKIAAFNSSTFFSKRTILDVWQDFLLKFIKPLAPGVHQMVIILIQTCIWNFQVCLSIYDLLEDTTR